MQTDTQEFKGNDQSLGPPFLVSLGTHDGRKKSYFSLTVHEIAQYFCEENIEIEISKYLITRDG